ncbi:MAG: chitobiase/beta-hexosaminidase C-terminal domain-containing protein, partial [Candidatus Sulfotelmatobacter sp.]
AMLTKNVNTASILLTVPTETATATVNGIAPVGAGTHNVDASYPGDSHYGAVTSSTIALTAGLAPLVVTPAPGTYTSPQTLAITEVIPGSTIYYELTGSVSTNGYVQYTGPVALPYGGVETLQAYATETGYDQSNYLVAQYTLNYPATPVPILSLPSGSYSSPQSLTITDSLTGATIYYTTGGTTPTTSSMKYTGPITVSSTETIEAIAVATGYSPSAVTTAAYISVPGFAPGPGGTTSLTVTPGATTGNTGTISVAGTNGFSGIVNLTCSVTTRLTGVNNMPTCSLNPTSVTISGAAAQTSTLTVNTTAASSTENQKRSLFWPSASGGTFALALLFVRPRRRKDCVAIIGLLLLFVSTGWLIACGVSGGGGGGGGNTGTTPGAYTITVTGTSGSVSTKVGTVALTVQ